MKLVLGKTNRPLDGLPLPHDKEQHASEFLPLSSTHPAIMATENKRQCILECLKFHHNLGECPNWELSFVGDVEKCTEDSPVRYVLTTDDGTSVYELKECYHDGGYGFEQQLIQRQSTASPIPQSDKNKPIPDTSHSPQTCNSTPKQRQITQPISEPHNVERFERFFKGSAGEAIKPGHDGYTHEGQRQKYEQVVHDKLQQFSEEIKQTQTDQSPYWTMPSTEFMQKEQETLPSQIAAAEDKVQQSLNQLGTYLKGHGVGERMKDPVYIFIKDCAGKEGGYQNMQHQLKHNFAFIKKDMLPDMIEHAQKINEAEQGLATLKAKQSFVVSNIASRENRLEPVRTQTQTDQKCSLHNQEVYAPRLEEPRSTVSEPKQETGTQIQGLSPLNRSEGAQKATAPLPVRTTIRSDISDIYDKKITSPPAATRTTESHKRINPSQRTQPSQEPRLIQGFQTGLANTEDPLDWHTRMPTTAAQSYEEIGCGPKGSLPHLRRGIHGSIMQAPPPSTLPRGISRKTQLLVSSLANSFIRKQLIALKANQSASNMSDSPCRDQRFCRTHDPILMHTEETTTPAIDSKQLVQVEEREEPPVAYAQETQHAAEIATPPQETIATSPTTEQVIGEQTADSTSATGDTLATLDFTHTTPTTSAQAYALMEKHGLLHQGDQITQEQISLMQQLSKLHSSIEQFCVNFNEAVKSGALKSSDKFLRALGDFFQHPLETISHTHERSNREFIAALQNHLATVNDSTITTTTEQITSDICEYVCHQDFFDRVEQASEQACDALFVTGAFVGATAVFEAGSAAISHVVKRGIPWREAVAQEAAQAERSVGSRPAKSIQPSPATQPQIVDRPVEQRRQKTIGNAANIRGKAFEDFLVEKLGGKGSFKARSPYNSREFDGAVGNIWYEAKSGKFWEMIESSPEKLERFQQSMYRGLEVSKYHSASYELHSNTPIPQSIKEWLTERGIKFTEWS